MTGPVILIYCPYCGKITDPTYCDHCGHLPPHPNDVPPDDADAAYDREVSLDKTDREFTRPWREVDFTY